MGVRCSAKQRQIVLYTLGVVAAVALIVALILFIQPVNRVIRAVNAGDYATARDIYWGNRELASGAHDAEISAALLRAADRVTSQYAENEISGENAASALANLGGIGMNGERLLSASYEDFHSYADSRDRMAAAERLFEQEEYLAAHDKFLTVLEDDGNYALARERAAESLELYAGAVRGAADMSIQGGDYAAAISALEAGKATLLGYEVYNEKLEYKLAATCGLFEQNLLKRAAALAAGGDYVGAAALIQQETERCGYVTEALTAAAAEYADQSMLQQLDGVAAQAMGLYEAGDAEGAFALLDTLTEDPALPAEAVRAAVSHMEERFAADSIAAARAAFAMDRDSLPGAVEVLTNALHIRRLEPIAEYRTELSGYLPANLSEVEYAEKDGIIFRSASVFEALSGVNYEKGWLWGEDGASVTFELNGGYDLLQGSFTVRREDDSRGCGWFEVLCDGEAAYTSPRLVHSTGETYDVSVSLTGCQTMVIRFHNDYSVRTAEDGYCYHGLCDAFMTKNIG
ncbi:MAG: NPCBM/NEW2 domain-containing protein [Oscillospiraceae bacterium]|nr:NPCBM/NEW2 domain-containing protein [Oscillospiraceae bacterium]